MFLNYLKCVSMLFNVLNTGFQLQSITYKISHGIPHVFAAPNWEFRYKNHGNPCDHNGFQ